MGAFLKAAKSALSIAKANSSNATALTCAMAAMDMADCRASRLQAVYALNKAVIECPNEFKSTDKWHDITGELVSKTKACVKSALLALYTEWAGDSVETKETYKTMSANVQALTDVQSQFSKCHIICDSPWQEHYVDVAAFFTCACWLVAWLHI